jgi:hypothetical protein
MASMTVLLQWLFISTFLVHAQDEVSPIYPTNKTFEVMTIFDEIYGLRNVSYWITSTGLAVIDGDVVYGTEEELLSKEFNETALIVEKRAFSAPSIWPAATITFRYNSDAAETAVSAVVNAAIAVWTTAAPYLTFTQLANSDALIPGVLTISADDCDGCHADLGFDATRARTMNLQQTCSSSPGICGVDEAVHEFGHLLGKRTCSLLLLLTGKASSMNRKDLIVRILSMSHARTLDQTAIQDSRCRQELIVVRIQRLDAVNPDLTSTSRPQVCSIPEDHMTSPP